MLQKEAVEILAEQFRAGLVALCQQLLRVLKITNEQIMQFMERVDKNHAVKDMWWDGPDFMVKLRNGKIWRFTNAWLKDKKEERPTSPGCTVAPIEIVVDGVTVGRVSKFTVGKE